MQAEHTFHSVIFKFNIYVAGWLDEMGGTNMIFNVIGVVELVATVIFILDYVLIQRSKKKSMVAPILNMQQYEAKEPGEIQGGTFRQHTD